MLFNSFSDGEKTGDDDQSSVGSAKSVALSVMFRETDEGGERAGGGANKEGNGDGPDGKDKDSFNSSFLSIFAAGKKAVSKRQLLPASVAEEHDDDRSVMSEVSKRRDSWKNETKRSASNTSTRGISGDTNNSIKNDDEDAYDEDDPFATCYPVPEERAKGSHTAPSWFKGTIAKGKRSSSNVSSNVSSDGSDNAAPVTSPTNFRHQESYDDVTGGGKRDDLDPFDYAKNDRGHEGRLFPTANPDGHSTDSDREDLDTITSLGSGEKVVEKKTEKQGFNLFRGFGRGAQQAKK